MSKDDDKELETMATVSGGNFDPEEVELWTKNIDMDLGNYDGQVITVNAADLAESTPSVTLKEVVFDNMLGEGAPGVTVSTTAVCNSPNTWYGHRYDNTDVTVTLNLNEEDPKEEQMGLLSMWFFTLTVALLIWCGMSLRKED